MRAMTSRPLCGAVRGLALPICRRLMRSTASLSSEPLPSAAFRRPKRLFSRFSSVASPSSRSWRGCSRPLQALLQPSLGSIPPQNAAISPISLTAITYFPDEFPISHNLLRNSQLSHPRRTRLAESGEFQQSRINFCEFKKLHSSRNSS